MSVNVDLRAWQGKFARKLAAHQRDDFLLVACPAAGKTIGAAAGVATVMESRDCDQLVVVCPTVVVRDQWASELNQLGYRMRTHLEGGGWPEHAHGICTTYAQVAQRVAELADACRQRRTVVVFDEVHHAGEQLSWGAAIGDAFRGAVLRLMLSGTPFRSDSSRIPFVSYDSDGACLPDFAYDYPRAVRDGVCRPIEFRAHDGEITWHEENERQTATFSQALPRPLHARRLRASLDPDQPYLEALLSAAHADVMKLRERIPGAAGLVVCDSQAHALEVDRLLAEITGSLPVLAMSDIPCAHQAIRSFADSDEPWIVSVRMVAEGVDIPRLGVIAWATTARTELMIRQVAGRALRSRGEHTTVPAIVHMPADPQLMEYARRIDVLAGVSRRVSRERTGSPSAPQARAAEDVPDSVRWIDPGPFLDWFDRQAAAVGAAAVVARCGWIYESGMRRLHRWRHGDRGNVLTLFDACHMADLDFDTLFAGDEYADARAFVRNPEGTRKSKLRAIEAHPAGDAHEIVPTLPTGSVHAAPEPVEISTPELPPSPEDIAAAEQSRHNARAELYQLLGVYSQLQRTVNPAYQLASAHAELAMAVGAIAADAPDEQMSEALRWIREQTSAFAVRHPQALKEVARARRRMAIARDAAA